MEGKTLTEKVSNLSHVMANQVEKVTALDGDVKALEDELARKTRDLEELKHVFVRQEEQLAELRRWKAGMAFVADLKTEGAILRRDVDKLEKVKEEWGRRIWAIAGPVLGAVVGWILGVFSRK